MPLYYLMQNITTKKGRLRKQYSMSSLSELPETTLSILVEKKVIREIQCPPVTSFEALKKYATILKKEGIETLGDFAIAPLEKLKRVRNAEALQAQVLDMLDPRKPLAIPDEDCCGDSPTGLEIEDSL